MSGKPLKVLLAAWLHLPACRQADVLLRMLLNFIVLLAGGSWLAASNPDGGDTLPLDGLEWKFMPGDDLAWAEEAWNAGDWQPVRLPHQWAPYSLDEQGYGWYRTVLPPPPQDGSREVLNLGVVGYACEVFLDGTLIYRSGDMRARMWQPFYLPDEIVLPQNDSTGKARQLAVRVRASWGAGGLLKGPWTLRAGSTANDANTAFFTAFQTRWTVSLAILCSIVIWIVILSLLLCLKRKPPGLKSILIFLVCLACYYPLLTMQLPASTTGYSDSQARLVNNATVVLTAAMIYLLTSSLYGLFHEARPKALNRLMIPLLLVAVGFSLPFTFRETSTNVIGLAAWLGSMLLALFLGIRVVWRALQADKPYSRSLGIALILVLLLFTVDILAFFLPMPTQLAPWLPLGASRAALISFSEIGLLILVFALGLSVLGRFLWQERHILSLSGELITASEKERLRFSRELHDGISPLLNSLRLQVHLLQTQQLEDDGKILTRFRHGIERSIRELRKAIDNERSGWLDNASLVEALTRYGEEVSKEHEGLELVIENHLPGNLALPSLLEAEVFRFFQEGLRNTIRHGRAKRIIWSLRKHDNGNLVFQCRDNGQGFNREKTAPGVGLKSAQERADLLQGEFRLNSAPGQGTSLEWTFTPAAVAFIDDLQHV